MDTLHNIACISFFVLVPCLFTLSCAHTQLGTLHCLGTFFYVVPHFDHMVLSLIVCTFWIPGIELFNHEPCLDNRLCNGCSFFSFGNLLNVKLSPFVHSSFGWSLGWSFINS